MRRAAELRATHPTLRTPDAIHVATAQFTGATHLVTNDVKFARLNILPSILCSDLEP